MAVRIVLGLSALVWLPYGLFCFFVPGYLAGAAGVEATTPTGTIELQAMYGGLQAGIGVLCTIAIIREDFVRPALFTLAFLTGGLFVSRLAAAAASGSVDAYTGFALGFELLTAGISVWFLRSSAAASQSREIR